MAISLQLQEAAANVFAEMAIKRAVDIKAQIKVLEKELEATELLIKQLKMEPDIIASSKNINIFYGGGEAIPDTNPREAAYNKDWTWEKKIKYIIREKGYPLSTAEIVKRLMDIEPYLTDRGKIVGSISATLSIKTRSGVFVQSGTNAKGESIFDINKNAISTTNTDGE